MKKIRVRSRLAEYEAVTDGVVAAFDRYDPDAGRKVRHYLLLEESVKLMHEPWGWKNRWYVDLARITRGDGSAVEVDDLYLDLIVEGNGPTYHMIDLDDLGDALASGAADVKVMNGALHGLQVFLDSHLHRRRDFPPACIRPFMPGASD